MDAIENLEWWFRRMFKFVSWMGMNVAKEKKGEQNEERAGKFTNGNRLKFVFC